MKGNRFVPILLLATAFSSLLAQDQMTVSVSKIAGKSDLPASDSFLLEGIPLTDYYVYSSSVDGGNHETAEFYYIPVISPDFDIKQGRINVVLRVEGNLFRRATKKLNYFPFAPGLTPVKIPVKKFGWFDGIHSSVLDSIAAPRKDGGLGLPLAREGVIQLIAVEIPPPVN